MAIADLQFTEGFDAYASVSAAGGMGDRWIPESGVFNSGNSLQAGRFGGQCYRYQLGNFTTRFIKNFKMGAANRMAAGLGIRFISFGAGRALFGSGLAFAVKAGFGVDATGKLVLYNGPTTVVATTAGIVFTVNTWHTFEFELTATTAKAWCDGALVMDLSGLALGMAGSECFFLGQRYSSGGTLLTLDVDDIWVSAGATADRIGVLGYKVETTRPSADVIHNWAHSAGASGFDVLNETVVSVADFNESATLNDIDLFEMVDLSGSPVEIKAMQICAVAYRTDATFRNLSLFGHLNGNEVFDTDWALPNTWAGREFLFTSRPGGGDWTVADANAFRAGYKVTL